MTSESSDRSGDQTPTGTNDGFVREHFAKNGLDWGVGDLLLAAGSLDVLGELLACVLNTFEGQTQSGPSIGSCWFSLPTWATSGPCSQRSVRP
jgi:hypothetical protein